MRDPLLDFNWVQKFTSHFHNLQIRSLTDCSQTSLCFPFIEFEFILCSLQVEFISANVFIRVLTFKNVMMTKGLMPLWWPYGILNRLCTGCTEFPWQWHVVNCWCQNFLADLFIAHKCLFSFAYFSRKWNGRFSNLFAVFGWEQNIHSLLAASVLWQVLLCCIDVENLSDMTDGQILSFTLLWIIPFWPAKFVSIDKVF